jgi:hypothetical protein
MRLVMSVGNSLRSHAPQQNTYASPRSTVPSSNTTPSIWVLTMGPGLMRPTRNSTPAFSAMAATASVDARARATPASGS